MSPGEILWEIEVGVGSLEGVGHAVAGLGGLDGTVKWRGGGRVFIIVPRWE